MPVIGHAANNGHLSFIYKLGQDEFEIKSLYFFEIKNSNFIMVQSMQFHPLMVQNDLLTLYLYKAVNIR